MSNPMSRIAAVRAFLEKDSKPVPTSEMMLFWKACSDEERAEFSEAAAKSLGVTLQ